MRQCCDKRAIPRHRDFIDLALGPLSEDGHTLAAQVSGAEGFDAPRCTARPLASRVGNWDHISLHDLPASRQRGVTL